MKVDKVNGGYWTENDDGELITCSPRPLRLRFRARRLNRTIVVEILDRFGTGRRSWVIGAFYVHANGWTPF